MYTPEKIRELRKSLGLTMLGFAELLGVSESTVSLWEAGSRHPKYDTLVKIDEIARRERDRETGPIMVG